MLQTLTTTQLPRRPVKLTQKNSVRKSIRIPTVLKVFLLQWAANAGCSMNALVRKALTTRFHNPNCPMCHGPADSWLSLRVTHAEWDALKAYAAAWGIPMWKALLLLLSRPYCYSDRPRDTVVTHDVTHNYRSINKKNDQMNECAFASQNQAQINDPLWVNIVKLGVREHVATDLTGRYARELLEFTLNEVSRKSDRLVSPPAFFVWWLASGLAQWHYERAVAQEAALERKRNEPLAPYHRKWKEVKEELGCSVQIVNPEEWQRGLEHLRQALGIANDDEGTVMTCPQCGRTMKQRTRSGLCLRCVEAQLKAFVNERQQNIAKEG